MDETYKLVESNEAKLQQLETTLREHGIPVDQWTGEKGTKTVYDLFHEIEEGETEIDFLETGEVLRIVHVVAGDITYQDPETEKIYRLKEDRQVSKVDGNVKRRPELKGAVAEKMKVGEDPREATLRGIAEELGIKGNFEVGPEEIIEETRLTPTYPGLNSMYKIHRLPVRIDTASYRPEGYSEEQPKKTSYFIWEEISSYA